MTYFHRLDIGHRPNILHKKGRMVPPQIDGVGRAAIAEGLAARSSHHIIYHSLLPELRYHDAANACVV